MLTEVPVTPATRVIDVVEYCKEAGEGECHLAEVWNGRGGYMFTLHLKAQVLKQKHTGVALG